MHLMDRGFDDIGLWVSEALLARLYMIHPTVYIEKLKERWRAFPSQRSEERKSPVGHVPYVP